MLSSYLRYNNMKCLQLTHETDFFFRILTYGITFVILREAEVQIHLTVGLERICLEDLKLVNI